MVRQWPPTFLSVTEVMFIEIASEVLVRDLRFGQPEKSRDWLVMSGMRANWIDLDIVEGYPGGGSQQLDTETDGLA